MYRLILIGSSIFGISSRLQIPLYIKIPRQTIWLCFDIGTMNLMLFKLYIQKINIVCIQILNHRSDGGESIGEFFLYSGSTCELNHTKSLAQPLHILYVRYNLGVLQNSFALNLVNQKMLLSNN